MPGLAVRRSVPSEDVMTQYSRIHLQPTVDNPTAPAFYFDLVLDADGRLVGRHAVFGLRGDFHQRNESFEPCVLHPDGQLDFGMGYEADPALRYADTDLLKHRIGSGEKISVTQAGEKSLYRVARVIALPAHKG
jgi:hypothetical protein